MVGSELKLQRVIFLLTFQGQMRVLTVWPLFTWGCKLDLVTGSGEMRGAEPGRGAGATAGGPGCGFGAAPSAAPLIGNHFSLCFSDSLGLFSLFGFLFFSDNCVMTLGGI